jgi:hypothetical protein
MLRWYIFLSFPLPVVSSPFTTNKQTLQSQVNCIYSSVFNTLQVFAAIISLHTSTMTLTYRNAVSIAELVGYIPAAFIATYLAIRHGFRGSSGWLYLIAFSLARIIGPCMQLATIKSPDNVNLYVGSAILNVIGLSPLQLATIGLLTRLLDSIHKSYNTFLHVGMFHVIQLIIMVGLILGIVGGIDAGNTFQTTGQYHPGSLNKAGTCLLIISYGLIVIFTAVIGIFISHAEAGEKRIYLAVVVALPILLIRIIYSALSTFSKNNQYNVLTGSTTLFLCVCLLEEFIIVVIYEATGLTLVKQVKEEHIEAQAHHPVNSTDSSSPMQPKQKSSGNMVLNILKKTIIGRLVMAIVGSGKRGNRDMEMQQPRQ